MLEASASVVEIDMICGHANLPERITVVGCWAHVRRKFDEAVKALPKGKANRLNPYRYLTWLLKTANNASLTDCETVEKLLPWNAAAECHAK